jgi:hypothetical protein
VVLAASFLPPPEQAAPSRESTRAATDAARVRGGSRITPGEAIRPCPSALITSGGHAGAPGSPFRWSKRHLDVRSTLVPGCCSDAPVAASPATGTEPRRAFSVPLVEDIPRALVVRAAVAGGPG